MGNAGDIVIQNVENISFAYKLYNKSYVICANYYVHKCAQIRVFPKKKVKKNAKKKKYNNKRKKNI